MADPQTTQNPETLPVTQPETTLGIAKIRDDIAKLKLDAIALETKRTDFEKNKKTLAKEEADKIKKEIDVEAKRIEAKKTELLTLIKQTKGELEVLKWSVETSVEKASLEALEKEIKEIKWENKNVFVKIRDRGVENPKTAIAATVGLGFLVRGIVRLFKKKKSETEDGEGKKETKKSKVRKWILGIWAWVVAIFGIGWLIDKFKGETVKPKEDQADDYDKLTAAEKEKYTTFWDKVNTMYGSMYQKEVDDGLVNDATLGKWYNSTDAKKYEWVVPFAMDKTYSTIHDMLREWAINRHIWKKDAEEYKAIIIWWGKDKLADLLWPTLMKIQSFSVLWWKPGADISEKIQEWLTSNADEACAELDMFFRQFIMVLTYLEEKRIQVRRQLTINAINAVGFNSKKLTGLDQEEQDDLIEDAMDDKERMKKNVDTLLKTEFDDQKINTIGATLTKYTIYDEKISEELTKEIKDLDTKRDDLLDYDEDSKTDILDRAETDIADGTLESGTKKDLGDCADRVLKDAINENGEWFMQKYFEPFAIACGMASAAREKFLEQSWGKEFLANFALTMQKYKDKFTTGTVTKEDVTNFKIIMTKYMAFKKEAVIAVHTMQNIGEDNPDRRSRYMNAYRAALVGFYEACTTADMPLFERVTNLCTGLVVAGTSLYLVGTLGKFVWKWKFARNTGKLMIKIWWAPAYGILKLSLRWIKRYGGKSLMSGRYRESKVRDSSDPDQLFRRAVMSGEISPKRAMKMVKNPKLKLKNAAGGNLQNIQELLVKFGAKDTEQANLILKYLDNPNTKKLILQKNKLATRGKEDRLKLNVWERSLRYEYEFAQDNLIKIKDIDAVIQANKSRNSGKVLESLLANVDEKSFTKLHGLIQSSNASWTGEIDALFVKMWSKLDVEKFGKLLGKNLDQFTTVADLQKLFSTIETGNLDSKWVSVIIRKRKDVEARLAKWEKLNDIVTQLNKNFIKKIVSSVPEVVKTLSADQKVVAKFIGDDIDELSTFIKGELPKQWGAPWSILELHYKNQLKRLEEFKLKISEFTAPELLSFKNLRKVKFTSTHIVELFELWETNTEIKRALTAWTDDIDELLTVLNREEPSIKKAWKQISKWLIEGLESLKKAKIGARVGDEIYNTIKSIFKFVAKVT